MMSIRFTLAVALGLMSLCLPSQKLVGQETLPITESSDEFRPCLEHLAEGRVNWTDGVILANGKGIAEGITDQHQLMARRAAELDAAANALALSLGINVNASNRAGDLRNGRRLIKGRIKGHKLIDEKWFPERRPPEYHVTMRVPLWGAKGVSQVLSSTERHLVSKRHSKHLPLSADPDDISDIDLVIDARGIALRPCLFPSIANEDGEVLYDITTVSDTITHDGPLARYVELDQTQTARCGQTGIRGHGQHMSFQAMTASYQPTDPEHTSPQPTTPPEPRQTGTRRRRRVMVKAIKAEGKLKSRVILTKEDAEKLRKSKTGANLLRHAHVLIVLDAPAAGVQGLRHIREEQAILAQFP